MSAQELQNQQNTGKVLLLVNKFSLKIGHDFELEKKPILAG